MSCKNCKKSNTTNQLPDVLKRGTVIEKKDLKALDETNVFGIYNKYAKEPITECECPGIIQKMILILKSYGQKSK